MQLALKTQTKHSLISYTSYELIHTKINENKLLKTTEEIMIVSTKVHSFADNPRYQAFKAAETN